MKSNLPLLFILAWLLVITGAILYAWSDNTPNGVLGMRLETASIVLVAVGIATLIYDYITNNKPKQ